MRISEAGFGASVPLSTAPEPLPLRLLPVSLESEVVRLGLERENPEQAVSPARAAFLEAWEGETQLGVNIFLKDPFERRYYGRRHGIESGEPVSTVLDEVAKEYGVCAAWLRVLFDGRRLSRRETPRDLSMEAFDLQLRGLSLDHDVAKERVNLDMENVRVFEVDVVIDDIYRGCSVVAIEDGAATP